MACTDPAWSQSKTGYIIAFVAVGLQILLAGFGLWAFIDMEPCRGDLTYTWLGFLLPVALFLAHCAAFYFLWRSSKQVRPRLAGLVLSSVLPMVCVGLWWLLVVVTELQDWPGGNVYHWLVQSGLLPPRDLIALKWLGAVLCAFTLAALLGLVPLGMTLRIVGRARKRRDLRIVGLVALLIPAAIVLAIVVLWIVMVAN